MQFPTGNIQYGVIAVWEKAERFECLNINANGRKLTFYYFCLNFYLASSHTALFWTFPGWWPAFVRTHAKWQVSNKYWRIVLTQHWRWPYYSVLVCNNFGIFRHSIFLKYYIAVPYLNLFLLLKLFLWTPLKLVLMRCGRCLFYNLINVDSCLVNQCGLPDDLEI